MSETEQADVRPEPVRRFRWVRSGVDRVPTRWFAGIATGLFLAGTAAFGGLATAATPSIPELEPGEAHVTAQRTLTIERAVLVDELPEAGVYPDPDRNERVVAILAIAENRWTSPQSAAAAVNLEPSAFARSVSVGGLPSEGSTNARYDDGTVGPWLQPGVPVELVMAWTVDADAFADGDEIEVVLNSLSLYTASFVAEGEWWQDPVASATMTLTLDDLGAGS